MKGEGDPLEAVDVDPGDGRRETENQRMDRNWIELLQELRVTQTGTQILFGFLLAIAFQPRFADLDGRERTVYLILVGLAATTTALALAPVAMHRRLFRQHRKRATVEAGHIILSCALIGVALVLIGTVLLVFDVILGPGPALAMAGVIAVVILVVGLLPALLARRVDRRAR